MGQEGWLKLQTVAALSERRTSHLHKKDSVIAERRSEILTICFRQSGWGSVLRMGRAPFHVARASHASAVADHCYNSSPQLLFTGARVDFNLLNCRPSFHGLSCHRIILSSGGSGRAVAVVKTLVTPANSVAL